MVMSTLVTGPTDDSGLSNSAAWPTTSTASWFLCKYLSGHSRHVGGRYLFYSGAEPIEIVEGISIEFVSHLFAQNLFRRIQIEDEAVQDGILGSLDLRFRNWILGDTVNLLIQRLNRFDRAAALGPHLQSQSAEMVK